MQKPRLIIVTGRPGAGKTTLARTLSQAAHLPVVSRDEIKEGYVHTRGQSCGNLPPDTNAIVTNLFFKTVEQLLDGGVSLIAEAAFQHRLWHAHLTPLAVKAQIEILICRPGDDCVAQERYLQRGLADPAREYFHGDPGVDLLRRGIQPQLTSYDAPHLDVPTHFVDTSDGFDPSIDALVRMLGLTFYSEENNHE